MADREDNSVTPAERHDLRPGLHPRRLLHQHELATREVLSRLGEENGRLEVGWERPPRFRDGIKATIDWLRKSGVAAG